MLPYTLENTSDNSAVVRWHGGFAVVLPDPVRPGYLMLHGQSVQYDPETGGVRLCDLKELVPEALARTNLHEVVDVFLTDFMRGQHLPQRRDVMPGAPPVDQMPPRLVGYGMGEAVIERFRSTPLDPRGWDAALGAIVDEYGCKVAVLEDGAPADVLIAPADPQAWPPPCMWVDASDGLQVWRGLDGVWDVRRPERA